jgi:ribosomal protein L7/L12
MPTLEVWRCGNCGGNVSIDSTVLFCGFCGAALAPPAPREPERFDVRLDDPGTNKIGVIKALAELFSLSNARDLVNGAPCVVLGGVSQERARDLHQKLLGAGARATVIGGGAPAYPDPLVLGGMLFAGTQVEARRASDGVVLASARVATSQLELRIPTGGAPVGVYLVVRRDGELPMVVHFNRPLCQSRALAEPFLLPRQLYESFARLAGVSLQPGTGILALRARHDEVTPDLAGVRFSVAPDLALVYADERGGVTPGLASTSRFGCAFAFNVPPGRVEIGAASWPGVTVDVVPDHVTEIQMWR